MREGAEGFTISPFGSRRRAARAAWKVNDLYTPREWLDRPRPSDGEGDAWRADDRGAGPDDGFVGALGRTRRPCLGEWQAVSDYLDGCDIADDLEDYPVIAPGRKNQERRVKGGSPNRRALYRRPDKAPRANLGVPHAPTNPSGKNR